MRNAYATACGVLVLVLPVVCARATAGEATGSRDPAAPKQIADTIAGLEAKLAAAEKTIAELRQKLDAVTRRRDEFQDLLAESEKQRVNAEKELARIRDARKTGIREPERTERIPEIPDIPDIRGKVTAVDEKAGRVTIDQGAKSHVQKGYSFIIWREETYVGKVIVEEVSPDSCKARFITELMRENPKVGDLVATRLMVEF